MGHLNRPRQSHLFRDVLFAHPRLFFLHHKLVSFYHQKALLFLLVKQVSSLFLGMSLKRKPEMGTFLPTLQNTSQRSSVSLVYGWHPNVWQPEGCRLPPPKRVTTRGKTTPSSNSSPKSVIRNSLA